MTCTLHSLSIYEEIVAHNNLKMMTKFTDFLVETESTGYFGAKQRSEAFCNALIGATEATIVERIESKRLSSALD